TCTNGQCACPSGQTLCNLVSGKVCADLMSDRTSCGACGFACVSTAHCTNGHCCPNGLTWCSSSSCTSNGQCCVDTRTDASNCGTCGYQCPPIIISGVLGGSQSFPQICTGGICCPPGHYNSNGICCNTGEMNCSGTCVAIGTDTNCGGCGDNCSN